MQYTIPDYYKKFTCIAGACPDTCCAGWQIVIDHRTMRKYQRLRTPFGIRLRNGIDRKEGAFIQHKGRCEFLNEENLCDIYCEVGEEMLCRTCKRYPRHFEEFEGLREMSLSISCPEAARIILSQTAPVRFLHREREGGQEEFVDFDYLLFTVLMDTREEVFWILQQRQETIGIRMAKALAFVHDIQCALDRGEQYRCQGIKEQHRKTGFSDRFHQKWKEHRENVENPEEIMEDMWKTLTPELEVLRDTWPEYLKESLLILYGSGEKNYQRVLGNFKKKYQAWELEAEQMLVYWVFTYFCGAVYDGDVFTKMKLAVAAVLFIRDLDAACLERQGDFTKEDQIAICYRYSRELEHSDLNLDKMEKLLHEKEAFSFDKMLLLCED